MSTAWVRYPPYTPLRPFGRREHTFAGLDVALTPWPETEAQLAEAEDQLAKVRDLSDPRAVSREEIVRRETLARADAQDGAPAARPRISAAGAVGMKGAGLARVKLDVVGR